MCKMKAASRALDFFVLNCFFAAASIYAAAPDNDNFAARRLLVGTIVQDSVDNSSATVEPGEIIDTNRYGRTVWWTWTAPTDGQVTIQTSNYCSISHGDALSNLVLVGDNGPPSNPFGPRNGSSPIRLHVSSDETLQISVASTKQLFI